MYLLRMQKVFDVKGPSIIIKNILKMGVLEKTAEMLLYLHCLTDEKSQSREEQKEN